MARLVRVSGPLDEDCIRKLSCTSSEVNPPHQPPTELSMQQAVQQILDDESVVNDVWSVSRNRKMFQVEFSVMGEDRLERFLDKLAFHNVGKTTESSIMVIEPTAFICKRERAPKTGSIPQWAFQDFLRSLKSRLCVAQVYHEIQQRGTFDMNYLCFLLCAALVADMALVTNSSGVVFASMLLSPLMDPILCILFGLTLREKHMLMTGVRNTGISLLLCICLGLSFGYVAHMVSCFEGITPYPTSEMKLRGQAKSFVASVMVSSFSGISVAFATLSRRLTALIGNAISLSLLPPAVNSGQLLLLAVLAFMQKTVILPPMEQNDTLSRDTWHPHPRCVYPWIRNYEFIYMDNECDAAQEFAALSAFSFLLVTMNILVILVTGYTVNKLKDMAPRAFTNETVRRFYQKDLPEFRKTYHCLHKLDAAELATCAYKEYLRLNRVNPESDGELDPEESERIASEFRAVLQGVGKNHHVQTVSAKADFGGQFLKSFLSHSELLAGQRRHSSRANTTYHASCLENGKIISMAKMYHTTHDKPVQFGGDFEEALQRRRLTETWMDRAATLSSRLRQLELLGEVDSESESPGRTSRHSSKLFIAPKDQNQCQNVGKFHVVPTQLSMSRMGSANDKATLEERV